MTDVPTPVQDRIEAVLAETELAVIDIQRSPEQVEPDGDGGFRYLAPSHGEQTLAVVVRALSSIVQAVLEQNLPARTRRTVVEHYRDTLSARYAISSTRLVPALRKEAWWLEFQRALLTQPPMRRTRSVSPQSLGQRIRALMDQVHWSAADLARHTQGYPEKLQGLSRRQIIRLLNDDVSTPQPETLRVLEYAFNQVLNPPITLSISPQKKSPPRH